MVGNPRSYVTKPIVYFLLRVLLVLLCAAFHQHRDNVLRSISGAKWIDLRMRVTPSPSPAGARSPLK